MERVGSASGMVATAARTGGAMGVALSATLFSALLAGAGLSQKQIETPQSWNALAETVVTTFGRTVFIISLCSILAVIFSAVRNPGRKD
jgi:uncharacterized membrane protein